jgi:hypothetical protein
MALEQTMVEAAFVPRPDWATGGLAHFSLGLQACVETPQADPTFCLRSTRAALGKG